MAKISELTNGGLIQTNDLFLISRGSGNYFIKGDTLQNLSISSINVIGAVNGSAIFSTPSVATITTTLAPAVTGFSNNILIDDGTGILKKRAVNPYIWNTTSVPPVTSTLMSDGFIAKAVSPNGITNSVIKQDSANNVGIGMNPTVELTVSGQLTATQNISSGKNIISTLDTISNQNLSVSGNSVLGKDSVCSTTINGTANFPSASSVALALNIGGDVKLYRSQANTLKTDNNLIIGTLTPSTISNDILVQEAGLVKTRTLNPFVWNTTSSPITGNLTPMFIPKAASPNSLANSVMREDGTGNIGIGINPNVALTVAGQISSTNNIISTLDTISNQNLSVSGNSVLGKDSVCSTTINGTANFPSASSVALALNIGGDVKLYRSQANTLKTDNNLIIGTLTPSTTSNDILVQEAGLVKTRTLNPFVWVTGNPFLSGNGTSNFLSKYVTLSTLGNSSIYETPSNNIGVGTTNPNEKVTISGNLSAGGTGILYATQSVLGKPPLSATLNVQGTYLQTENGSGDYVIRIQDGTGKINHYWNSMGGPSPTYMRSNERATKFLFGGGDNQELFQISTSSFTSPMTGVAGGAIAWQTAFTITSSGEVIVPKLSSSSSNQLIVHDAGCLKTRPIPEDFVISCSDETTNLLSGVAVTFRMPYAMTLTSIRASVNTAPTGSKIIVDVKQSGITLFSTLLTIDIGKETSLASSVAPVLSAVNLLDDAKITVNINQIGSTVPGKGLKLTFKGYRA